ncbi:MAG TPA: site-2 protease family protein, partial [Candidatus Woesebacteria bacterium]|nr:site-2 protease family protein [Candidatus Woesebacteria bacterium]
MLNILIVILIISFLVLIHELGHYLVARKHNVAVEEFGFGYPPRITSLFTYRGTLFTLNAIPIGGFVRLLGESEDFELGSTPIVHPKHTKYGEAFYLKSAWARALIVGAGVATNLLFATLAFSLVFSFLGIPSSLEGRVRIGQIAPDSPAAHAQLPINVEILEIRTLDQSYQVDGIEV